MLPLLSEVLERKERCARPHEGRDQRIDLPESVHLEMEAEEEHAVDVKARLTPKKEGDGQGKNKA